MATYELQGGYAYEYVGKDWRRAPDEEWDTLLVPGFAGEGYAPVKFVGTRKIDGAEVAVFRGGDAYYLAQLVQNARKRTFDGFGWTR